MRTVLVLVLLATVALVPTTEGGRQEAGVTGAELRAYLTKVGAVAPKYVTWKGNAWRAVQVAPIAWELDDPETTAGMARTLNRANNELTPIAARMAKVAAPADLRVLHAGFTNSITTEAKCTRKVATVVENGGNPKASVDSCTRAFAGTTERQKHWRTEVTVAARRLGVILPFWVKKVGVSPK